MLNKIFLQGRLTKDPEIKATNSGKTVAVYCIACDRDFKDSAGERGVDFVNIVSYGYDAEFVKSYYSKGSMALIVGRLQLRSWEDKDGNKRYATEVVTEHVYFGEGKKKEDWTAAAATAPAVNADDFDDGAGELPF